MPEPNRTSAWRWLAALARPYWRRLIIAAFALVLGGGVSLVLPMAAGWVVDAALVKRSIVDLEKLIGALLVLFAVSGTLDFAEVYSLRSTAAFILQGLRARLHAHLLELTPAFFESQRTGDLLSRITSDIDQIGTALTHDIVSGLQQGLVLVGAIAILIAVHPALTGVMLLAVPPVVVAAVLIGLRLEKLSKERQAAAAEANVAAEESLAGIRTVQAFAREPEEEARYGARLARVTALALRTARAWGVFSGVVSFLAFAAIALVLGYGGRLVVSGALSAGQLTSFLLYTLTIAGAVGALTHLYGSMKTALGATDRVREILETPAAVIDPAAPVLLARPVRGHVELRGVRFSYPAAEGRTALSIDALEARPGEVLALVGPSGAGKSTAIALLLRFYEAQEGAIAIDGVDLRRVALRELRGAIGLVPQDIFLFGGTVAENIRYGRPDATDEDVRAAADAAQAARFIDRLPQGYATAIGERGVKLSAGERQRIAIARVFLKDPAIVVLDEATSALDSESEHLVARALERLMAGRTTIVIAHRLATVRRAHQVAVLDAGEVRERGTHAELFERSPLYRRLCELQMLDPTASMEYPSPGKS